MRQANREVKRSLGAVAEFFWPTCNNAFGHRRRVMQLLDSGQRASTVDTQQQPEGRSPWLGERPSESMPLHHGVSEPYRSSLCA